MHHLCQNYPVGTPPVSYVLYNPLSLNVGRTCNLILGNRRCQRWHHLHNYITWGSVLVSWSKRSSCWHRRSCCVKSGPIRRPPGKDLQGLGELRTAPAVSWQESSASVLRLQGIGFCQKLHELGRGHPPLQRYPAPPTPASSSVLGRGPL